MLNGGKLDWKRVGTASLFGAIFVGPVGNFWSVGGNRSHAPCSCLIFHFSTIWESWAKPCKLKPKIKQFDLWSLHMCKYNPYKIPYDQLDIILCLIFTICQILY
jgi:hypothetical protein